MRRSRIVRVSPLGCGASSLFPRRVRGITVDSHMTIEPWPLEQVCVPTLRVSAEDHLYRTLPGARYTAGHIPGCELKILKNGGHLMLGQDGKVRKLVRDFLTRTSQRSLSVS